MKTGTNQYNLKIRVLSHS